MDVGDRVPVSRRPRPALIDQRADQPINSRPAPKYTRNKGGRKKAVDPATLPPAERPTLSRSRAKRIAKLIEAGDLPESALIEAAARATGVDPAGVLDADQVPFRRTADDTIREQLREVMRRRTGLSEELPTLPGVQSLSIATRYMEGGRARFIEFVQAAMLNGSQPALKWLIVFRDLSEHQRLRVSYDDICAASGVRPSEIIAAITATAVEIGVDVGNMVAALTHPQVVAAGVAAAKRPDGVEDRKMLFSHQAFIPVPKNTQTVVNVNASASAQAASSAQAAGGLPSFAEDLKLVGQGRAPAARALPAAVEAEAEEITFDQSPADAEDFDYGDQDADADADGHLAGVLVDRGE